MHGEPGRVREIPQQQQPTMRVLPEVCNSANKVCGRLPLPRERVTSAGPVGRTDTMYQHKRLETGRADRLGGSICATAGGCSVLKANEALV